MRFFKALPGVFALLFVLPVASDTHTLKLTTENYPPFNMATPAGDSSLDSPHRWLSVKGSDDPSKEKCSTRNINAPNGLRSSVGDLTKCRIGPDVTRRHSLSPHDAIHR